MASQALSELLRTLGDLGSEASRNFLELENQVVDLKESLQRRSAQLQEQTDRVKRLSDHQEVLTERLDSTKQIAQSESTRAADLEKRLDEAKLTMARMSDEVLAANKRQEILELEVDALKTENIRLDTYVTNLSGRADTGRRAVG